MDDQDVYATIPSSFAIDLLSTTSRINIYCTGGLANIGTISWSGSTSVGSVDVIIGSGALNTVRTVDLSNAAQNWGGVSFPFSARLSGAIAGNLTGSINPVSIVRLEVHGQLSAAISASATSGTAIGILQLGSSNSGGTITAGNSSSGGDIFRVETESGTLAGAVSALSGKIENILCAGAIAISASPGIAARDGIDNLVAASVTADVVANANGGSGGLAGVVIDGDLTGAVAADALHADQNYRGMTIDGECDGVLTFGSVMGDIVAGSFAPTASIVIGSLAASIEATGDIPYIHAGTIAYSTRDGDTSTRIVS